MGCEAVSITVNPQVVDIVILDGDTNYKKNAAFLRQKNTPVNVSFRPSEHDKRTVEQKSIDKNK
jgi:hypothetical protein